MNLSLRGRRATIASAGGLRGGAIAARAVVGLLLARFLGAAEVGVFFLAVAVGGLVALVARAGLDRLALAEVGRRPGAARAIAVALGRHLLVSSIVLVGLALVVVAVIPLPGDLDRTALVLALIAAVPLNIVLFCAQVLRGGQRTGPALVIGELLPPVLRLIVFLALPLSLTASRAAAAFAIGWGVAAVLAVVAVARLGGDDRTATRWALTDPWRQTGPLFTFVLGGQLRDLATIGLGWSVGTPADVGGLGTATRLEQMSLLPTTATRFVTAPELVSHGSRLPAATTALAVRTARRALAIQLPILAAVAALAPQLLGLLGSDFRPAAGFLRVLLLGALVNGITGSTTQTLLMSERRNRLATSSLLGLGVLVVTAVALAPLIGVLGVAVGAAAAHAAIGIIEWWFVRIDLGARIDVLAPSPSPPPVPAADR